MDIQMKEQWMFPLTGPVDRDFELVALRGILMHSFLPCPKAWVYHDQSSLEFGCVIVVIVGLNPCNWVTTD